MAEYLDFELSFPQEQCVQHFRGTINHHLVVHMTLQLEKAGHLVGSYLYQQYQQQIPLRGTFSLEDGHVMLAEYGEEDARDTQTGQFDGHFVTPNRIEGTWSNPSATRHYPFLLERGQQEIMNGQTSDGIAFRVLAVPFLNETRWAEDQIVLDIHGKEPLLLTRQWLAETCHDATDNVFLGGVNTSSIAVDMLSGTPELIQIAWETHPIARTMGETCLLIVPSHHVSMRLFESCLGSSFTQSERESWSYPSVIYTDNRLHITQRHSSWTLLNADGQPELREHDVTCSYAVTPDRLKLLNSSERTRSALGVDRGQGLYKQIQEVEWQPSSEETNFSCPSFE